MSVSFARITVGCGDSVYNDCGRRSCLESVHAVAVDLAKVIRHVARTEDTAQDNGYSTEDCQH